MVLFELLREKEYIKMEIESQELLKDQSKSSNITVLVTTGTLFAMFVIAEMIGALVSVLHILLNENLVFKK